MDELPILVYFEKQLPTIYEGSRGLFVLSYDESSVFLISKSFISGSLMEEEEVLKWITKQVKDDTIEEVTEVRISILCFFFHFRFLIISYFFSFNLF